MAAPTYVDAGTGATDATGEWSYTCQAAAAAGRVSIVHIFQDGVTTSALAVTGSTNINDLAGNAGWTIIPYGGTNYFPAGAPVWTGHHFLYIGRSTGTSAPTISGTNSTSEDLYIRSYQFADVSTGTTLGTVIENDAIAIYVRATSGTDGTIADAGVTTTGPDRLALNFVAISDDNAVAAFTTRISSPFV